MKVVTHRVEEHEKDCKVVNVDIKEKRDHSHTLKERRLSEVER
jgi:hypothetical protein